MARPLPTKRAADKGTAQTVRRINPRWRQTPLLMLALVVCAIAVIPIYWMLITSFKTPLEFLTDQHTWWPKQWTWAHYKDVLVNLRFVRFFGNTLFVSFASTLLSLAAGSMAAYSLARFRFPRRFDGIFLVWTLMIRTLPPVALVIPLFIMFREIGLRNVHVMLILSYQVYTLPLAVWMMLGFFREIPRELEEAAYVDGASRFYTLARIIYPLVTPGLSVAAIFCMISAWNEFTYALIFARAPSDFTIPIGLATLITEYQTLWGSLMAAGLISSLPLLALTVYVQRHLQRGYALGGLH